MKIGDETEAEKNMVQVVFIAFYILYDLFLKDTVFCLNWN